MLISSESSISTPSNAALLLTREMLAADRLFSMDELRVSVKGLIPSLNLCNLSSIGPNLFSFFPSQIQNLPTTMARAMEVATYNGAVQLLNQKNMAAACMLACLSLRLCCIGGQADAQSKIQRRITIIVQVSLSCLVCFFSFLLLPLLSHFPCFFSTYLVTMPQTASQSAELAHMSLHAAAQICSNAAMGRLETVDLTIFVHIAASASTVLTTAADRQWLAVTANLKEQSLSLDDRTSLLRAQHQACLTAEHVRLLSSVTLRTINFFALLQLTASLNPPLPPTQFCPFSSAFNSLCRATIRLWLKWIWWRSTSCSRRRRLQIRKQNTGAWPNAKPCIMRTRLNKPFPSATSC